MAETYFSRPAGGVCHLHARHTENYIVLTNELITRATIGLTVAMGLYIMWAPEGTSVTIESLCARWREGRTLMSRALRELEEIGFLERRVEQGPDGRLTTRTIIHHRPRHLAFPSDSTAPAAPAAPTPMPAPVKVPTSAPVVEPVEAVEPVELVREVASTTPTPDPRAATGSPAAPEPVRGNTAEPPKPVALPALPEAPAPVAEDTSNSLSAVPVENIGAGMSGVDGPARAPENREENPGRDKGGEGEPIGEAVMRIVNSLRRRDPRLLISERECRTLAPGINAWLARGATEAEVIRALSQGLPTVLRGRAAGILAWRLREHLPPPAPAPTAAPLVPAAPVPVRGKPYPCRGCHNVVLRPESGLTHCQACREAMTRAPAAA
ncbi:hypothetical protein [Streptomyces calidiresistens]